MRNLIALFLFFAVSAAARDVRHEIVGTWSGESLCTSFAPACHDEHAVYHVATNAVADSVHVVMNKVIDGEEQAMAEFDYTVDAAKRRLWAEFERNGHHAIWDFTWNGTSMKGVLRDVPTGSVIRNITLQKKR